MISTVDAGRHAGSSRPATPRPRPILRSWLWEIPLPIPSRFTSGRDTRAYGVTLGGRRARRMRFGSRRRVGQSRRTLGTDPPGRGLRATGSGWPAVYQAGIKRVASRPLPPGCGALGPRQSLCGWPVGFRPVKRLTIPTTSEQMETAVRILTSRGGRVAIATCPCPLDGSRMLRSRAGHRAGLPDRTRTCGRTQRGGSSRWPQRIRPG